jgi:MFS transporter, ACS family, 4-hydroxyphenylacetate permease
MYQASPMEEAAFAKVSRRLVWFLMLMVIINFLDRSNIGFAALQMNKALGLNASTFGLALSLFSLVYVICEIPSNIAMDKFGARIWLARIMITWGIAAAACCLVMGATSLISLRMLVGAAEAGLMPGVVLYVTYWLPQYRRAKLQANFMIAQPIAIAGGSLVSGLILEMDGFLGVAGWRWLFLLEGLPAVALGIVALYYLSDRPAKARWLSAQERDAVENSVRLDAEQQERESDTGRSIWATFFSRNMVLITISYTTLVFSYASSAYWLPQIIRGFTSPKTAYWEIGLLMSVPYVLTALVMPYWSARSDKAQERYWHSIIPMAVAGLGWIMAGVATTPVMQMIGITVETIASMVIWSLFWTMPSLVMPRRAHAVGIAAMNTVGMIGGIVSPLIIGFLRDWTGGFAAALVMIGVLLLIGTVPMLFVPKQLLSGKPAVPAQVGAVAD